jgi:hypothetical protein
MVVIYDVRFATYDWSPNDDPEFFRRAKIGKRWMMLSVDG